MDAEQDPVKRFEGNVGVGEIDWFVKSVFVEFKLVRGGCSVHF
jgi:hypothetical protein